MSENGTTGFIAYIDSKLKELMLLGFGIIDDEFVRDLNEDADDAHKLGFEFISDLLKNVASCADNYVRLSGKVQTLALVSAIAKVEFATSCLQYDPQDESSELDDADTESED